MKIDDAIKLLNALPNENPEDEHKEAADNLLKNGKTCPNDTDGDGDCGKRYCPICGKQPNVRKETNNNVC